MSKVTPELRLKKLRRLEHNVICPNCGTAAPQGLGFGSVCVKFNTFICDLCKTSHQAISHRVKSITMSNWTHDEVNALTAEYGGGNEAALHIWLQNAPAFGQKYRGGSRPKEGDRIDIFKNFVADCYDKGMFRATTPFVPSSSPATAQNGGESPKPSAATLPPRTSNLQVRKPAETVDFFHTDSEPSISAHASTGTDPFACGSAFGDASPVPAARSTFSSTTDLLGAGGAGTGASNSSSSSSSSSHTSPRFPAPPSAQTPSNNHSGLLFDAFNDTPGISPVASFAQFPSTFPPAAPAPAVRTGSGFDFIEGDPFSSSSKSASSAAFPATFDTANVSSGVNAVSSSFDSFTPTASAAASGFDFMTQGSTDPFAANRSGGSSITSSNMNSATNSAFTSNNDLFAFSTTTSAAAASAAGSASVSAAAHTALSAPSPVLPPPLQVPSHDPFGVVFLQPTPSSATSSSVGFASPYTPPSHQPVLQTPAHSHTGLSGMGAGRMGPSAGPGTGTGMNMNMNSMAMNTPTAGGGGYGMMNRGGRGSVSPVPGGMGMGMGGGIGYCGGGGSQYPPQAQGMGHPGMGHPGMGMSQGQQYPMHLQQQPYRPGPAIINSAGPAGSSPRVDAIGAAFGNLSMNGALGYRGPGQYPQQQQQLQQPQASSFDFVQSAVKQHLPTNTTATANARSTGAAMGNSMSVAGYQQYPPQSR